MLYEVYLPRYTVNFKKETDIEKQLIRFTSDTGGVEERSDTSLHYKIKGLDEVVLLNKSYKLRSDHNIQILEQFKDSLFLLGYELDDLLVTVRYVLSDFQLIEQLFVYTRTHEIYLPLTELKRVVEKQQKPLTVDNRLNPVLVRDLLEINFNQDKTSYDRPINTLDDLNTKYIKSNTINDKLKQLEGEQGYHNGESAHNDKLVWNSHPSARTGLLYTINDFNELELYHFGKYRQIPSLNQSKFRKLNNYFLNKNRASLAILFFYPNVNGYRFYHRDGTLLISLYSGEGKIKDLQDVAFTYSHYMLEQNSETV